MISKMPSLPANMTETEVMKVIDNVANRLARRFRFGYHDIDDMKQQARMFAWEGLDGYIDGLPLENYLWTHVRNRLFNFKRDKYERPGNPCDNCKEEKCDGRDCCIYRKWLSHNRSKKNLMNPIDIENVVDDKESNMRDYGDEDELEYRELLDKIRNEMPTLIYKIFVRLQHGGKVNKVQKTKVQVEVDRIMEKYHYERRP